MFENLCHGCLSSNRDIFPLIDVHLYYTLLHDGSSDVEMKYPGIQLCFECSAVLRKVRRFQKQIRNAQLSLVQQSVYGNNEIQLKYLSSLGMKVISNTHSVLKQESEINEKVVKLENDIEINLNLKVENDLNIDLNNDDYDNGDYINDYNIDDDATDTKEIECQIIKLSKAKSKKKESQKPKFQSEKVIVKDIEDVNKYCRPVKVCDSEDIYDELVKSNSESVVRMCILCRSKVSDGEIQSHLNLHNAEELNRIISYNKDIYKTYISAYKCCICEYVGSQSEVSIHIRSEHDVIYKCRKCDYVSKLRSDLSEHNKVLHSSMVCEYCGKNFQRRRTITPHLFSYHMENTCAKCSYRSKSTRGLQQHYKIHHKAFWQEINGKKAKTYSRENSYCVECDKQYEDVYRFRKHLATSVVHSKKAAVKTKKMCTFPGCGKSFAKTNNLNNHYKLFHLKKTDHYCDACDRYFVRAFSLRTHINYVHKKIEKSKNIVCDLCGRAFHTRRILTNHRRTHTGERPFQCESCPARFGQHAALRAHHRVHQPKF